jgi:hypothetical protein
MTNLKLFVAKQVDFVQKQLYNLLLIHIDKDRESITTKFNLISLKDDLSISELG